MSSDRVIELLLRNEASYVPTLWLLAIDEKPPQARYANLKRIAHAGVRVALGTDTFCGFGQFGENTIVEAERSVAAGIAPQKVLEMATKNAGEHLGNEALGTIASGQIADSDSGQRRPNKEYWGSAKSRDGNQRRKDCSRQDAEALSFAKAESLRIEERARG